MKNKKSNFAITFHLTLQYIKLFSGFKITGRIDPKT